MHQTRLQRRRRDAYARELDRPPPTVTSDRQCIIKNSPNASGKLRAEKKRAGRVLSSGDSAPYLQRLEKLPVAILAIRANFAMQVNRVIALGSPHGDDQVAWQLAERLRGRRDLNIELISLNDPLRICDHLEGCDRLVVIDACVGTGEPGTLSRLEWPDPRILVRHAHSSHGFGVAGALELAEQLGRLPPTVVLFAVEIAQCTPGGSLSDVLESVLGELRRKVLLEIQQAPNRRS